MKHTCHVPDCGVTVPRRMLMCARHWKRVPKEIQRAIWRHFKPEQCVPGSNVRPTEEWLDAAQRAVDAVTGGRR